jgi:hypothetical protein
MTAKLNDYPKHPPQEKSSDSPRMVEHRGFEPLTSTLRTSRATNCANAPDQNIIA